MTDDRLEKCQCGHPRGYHKGNGCLGALCGCKGFVSAQQTGIRPEPLTSQQLAAIQAEDAKVMHPARASFLNGAMSHRRLLLKHVSWLQQQLDNLQKKIEQLEQ